MTEYIKEDDYQYYKESYQEHQAILEVVCDQVTVADKNGIVIRVSDSCAENFGAPKENIIGHSCYELEKKGILSTSVTSEVLKSKREMTIIQETKAGRRLMVTGKPLFDEGGQVYRVINVSHDVTLEEELQRRLQETQNLLGIIKQQIQEEHYVDSPLILGCSEVMGAVFKMIKAVSLINVTILLQGETGVGKSVYANYIHKLSPQREQPFIQINCGAVPADLIESELFGYAPGAFTGASAKGKVGLLAAAKKGTIFLDEISEMPQALQVKLLHILQERKYLRIGETAAKPFTARVIAASNRDLKELVRQGKFREDLYYRLNVVPITIPPLRERSVDIPLLTTHFLRQANNKYNLHKRLSEQAVKKLQSYCWPGNVRELENTVERLTVIAGSDVIDVNDIHAIIPEMEFGMDTGRSGTKLKDILENVEREVLRKALKEQKTTRKIGETLGIDQSTVVKKLKKYNLHAN